MKKYLDWIRNNTFLKDLKENTIKVISPFLDAHNDYMRLYVKKLKDDSLIITDDGNLYHDVESYGIKWTDKKDSLFRSTLEAYGVSFNSINKEIFIKADFNNIGRAKHRIIQCLINLNDMFNLTQENLKELFFHEVYDYFLDSNIKFNHEKQIYKRDKYSCQKCDSIDNLFAHHILSWKDYPELRFELSNGITLCSDCHKKLHKGKTRNNPI